MLVGIIVYSKTGNTLTVAKRLKTVLEENGHTAVIDQIEAEVDEKTGKVKLNNNPDISCYDRLVFASPVWAFSLCAVMREYLQKLPELCGRSVCCFVTQHLRYTWLGGSRAIKKMRRLCAEKGSEVIGEGIITWSGERLQEQITELTERLASL